MRFFAATFCLLISSLVLFAQPPRTDVLASANGKTFSARDLPPEVFETFGKRDAIIANLRTELLAQQVAAVLLEAEAAARRTTVEKLTEAEMRRRVSDPTDAQIQAVYDANRASIGDRSLAEMRPQIVSFLRRDPEQKALMDFITTLKTKYKVVFGADVNAPGLKPADVLATVTLAGGKQITARDFEAKAGMSLADARMEIYERVREALEQLVYSEMIAAESKALGIQPNDLIAREVSDKMKEFSDDERHRLESALEKRLAQKYGARILLEEPAPFVQKISADDDPARGPAAAPVTVVMFTDFQCPACAATHPVLQQVLAEYGADKVRFVVRDYPLTTIHPNAFQAAQAAQAAAAQGKFFEYGELLYKNQNSLDTASLKRLAAEAGLNQKQFDADLDGGKFAAEVRKDMADGAAYGVNSTPTIFVNGVKVRRLSAAAFREAIERAMRK